MEPQKPEAGTTAKLPPSPFKKKLDAMPQEERLAAIMSLRRQIEEIQKAGTPFAEELKKMHARDAHEAAENVKKTFASVAGGDLNAAAFAVKMASLTPEMQQQALKYMHNLDAEKLTTHKLSTIALLELNQLKLMINQMTLHLQAITTAVHTVAIRQEDFISALASSASKEKATEPAGEKPDSKPRQDSTAAGDSGQAAISLEP